MVKRVVPLTEKRVSEIEFAAVQPFWDTSEERKSAARAVLFEGISLQEAANRIGCSRQNVSKVVSDFMSLLEKYYESRRIVSEMSGPRHRRATDHQQENQSATN